MLASGLDWQEAMSPPWQRISAFTARCLIARELPYLPVASMTSAGLAWNVTKNKLGPWGFLWRKGCSAKLVRRLHTIVNLILMSIVVAGLPERECIRCHAAHLLEELLHLPHVSPSGQQSTVYMPEVAAIRVKRVATHVAA